MSQNCRTITYFGFGILILISLGLNLYPQPNHVLAQDHKTKEILQRIEELGIARGSYQGMHTTRIVKKRKTEVVSGRFKFKGPNKRWQENIHQKDGIKSVIFSNGKVRWSYVPSRQFALKHDVEAIESDAQAKGWLSASDLDRSTLKYLKESMLGTEPVYVFEGEHSPLLKEGNPEKQGVIRLYFSVNDGILRKLVTYDRKGREITSQIQTNIQRVPNFSDEDFEFIPPEGTRIYEFNDIGPRRKSTN